MPYQIEYLSHNTKSPRGKWRPVKGPAWGEPWMTLSDVSRAIETLRSRYPEAKLRALTGDEVTASFLNCKLSEKEEKKVPSMLP